MFEEVQCITLIDTVMNFHKVDPLSSVSYFESVPSDSVVMVQCLVVASDVQWSPHEMTNVNFSCGSHQSLADVMQVTEDVCVKAVCPAGVIDLVEAAPMRNVSELSNSTVKMSGFMTSYEGDEARTLTTEYYLNSTFRQQARCVVGVCSAHSCFDECGATIDEETVNKTGFRMRTALAVYALNASGAENFACVTVDVVYVQGVMATVDVVQLSFYAYADARVSGADVSVPLVYKSGGFTGTGGSRGI